MSRPPLAAAKKSVPAAAPVRKSGPSDSTNAENFYYAKQIQQKTPMVVVLKDGEELHGVISWYDKSCVKLDYDNGGGAMVYKAAIKYMYKDE